MDTKRSRTDWVIEGVALAALVAVFVIAATYWGRFPRPRGFAFGRPPSLWTVRNGLLGVMILNVIAYVGLTLAGQYQKLIEIPEELAARNPKLRPMVFRLAIVMKSIVMVAGLCVAWALVNIGLRRPPLLHGWGLTLFALAIPLPLVLCVMRILRSPAHPEKHPA